MLKLFSKSPFLKFLEENTSKSFLFEKTNDAITALLACQMAKWTGRSILLITEGVSIDRLYHNISEIDPSLPLEFPSWETLPHEDISPSKDILGKRFQSLNQLLSRKGPSILILPIHSLLQKIYDPKKLLFSHFKVGEKKDFKSLLESLTKLGYTRESIVTDKGQFTLRGGILDIYPVSSSDPFRVEFFDDEIESIRTFDPTGQTSIEKVKEFSLTPADELKLLEEKDSLTTIDTLFEKPIFFWDNLVKLEDIYVTFQKIAQKDETFFAPLSSFFKEKEDHLYFTPENIEEISKVQKEKKEKFFQNISFDWMGQTFLSKRAFHPFQSIKDLSLLEPEDRFIFLRKTKAQEELIQKQISPLSLKHVHFEDGSLTASFFISDLSLAIISFADISGKEVLRRQKWRSSHHSPSVEFHALSPGDLVVHYHSGIGKYVGTEKREDHKGALSEFLVLEYKENSKLFVPLSQAHLISRYIGSKEEVPQLSQLGSKKWQKTRETAQAQIVGYANDLLERQARRIIEGGSPCREDSELMQEFEGSFPFVETEDQLLAINEIKRDMCSKKPMDRLICGDVGYGKTEVAMRAAFKAVVDGDGQVAVLVPTTVLASQHFENFVSRMQGFPIRIEVLSRFKKPKEIKKAIEETKLGNVDILIGTHRILSKDVSFKNLNLIIIDEEQRFGVRSKEHLKKFKAGSHCLTLSATPIPRTLHMSLVTARDMSTINTPPQDRLPIKTIIAETENDLMQSALLREFARGGQAYFIHNRVETIYEKKGQIEKLVPQAKIAVIHGQMDPEEVSLIVHAFKLGEIDLLFATTIIENGIDIPNANTILIDRADTYGMADLYQLRGRVGRWNRAAYTYFLIPKHVRMTQIAQKRLHALAESSGFGGGMKIAMRDLEIRGAGDILGVQQSGQVSQIGFHLYCKLLKRAVASLQKKKPISFFETKMEFSYPAHFPESYVEGLSLRMELYHRMGEISTEKEVDEFLNELQDRFGKPPEEVIWLYHLSKIRVFAANHNFTLLKFGSRTLIAERQLGKKTEKKTLLLPLKIQKPVSLEPFVINELKSAFHL